MYLERWLLEQAGQGLAALQLSRLKGTLEYVYRQSPFYRDAFDKAGVAPADLRSLADLARFPFTTAADLSREPYRFLCVSQSRVERVFTLYSGGTSGEPKLVFFSRPDLEAIAAYMGAAMKSVAESGGISGDGFRVYILLPDGKPQSQQRMLSKGVKTVAATPVAGDLSLNTEEQIKRIAEARPDILFGPVSRIHRMSLEASQASDLGRLGVRIVFITSEYVPPAMRQRLEGLWRAEVFTHYGMTEMGWAGGVECSAHHGLHFNEADLLLEVVDPDSGAVVAQGEEGELVLTTLNREAMPLVRYRTGDLGRLLAGSCTCGSTQLKRIGPLVRRKDALLPLPGGVQLHPSMLDDALFAVPDVLDYRASLEGEGDRLRLALQVELLRSGAAAALVEAVSGIAAVRACIEAGSMATPRVETVGRGMLPPRGRAKRVIADSR